MTLSRWKCNERLDRSFMAAAFLFLLILTDLDWHCDVFAIFVVSTWRRNTTRLGTVLHGQHINLVNFYRRAMDTDSALLSGVSRQIFSAVYILRWGLRIKLFFKRSTRTFMLTRRYIRVPAYFIFCRIRNSRGNR